LNFEEVEVFIRKNDLLPRAQSFQLYDTVGRARGLLSSSGLFEKYLFPATKRATNGTTVSYHTLQERGSGWILEFDER
jgi:hypothetical protein